MILREYKETDANVILSWIKNEREFRLWSADRYETYPIVAYDETWDCVEMVLVRE